MRFARTPQAALRPFVDLLWASDGSDTPSAASGRELVLPTGALHVVIRLGPPLRLFRDTGDAVGRDVASAVIGGPRAGPYLRDVARPAATVGALLRPGAAALLLGVPAGELAEAHTPLADAWGDAEVNRLRDRLGDARSPALRLALFEAALAARLPRLRGIDPLIAHALARLQTGGAVAALVDETGYSHRHVTRTFHAAVGLGPKTYGRIARFGRALDRLAAEPGIAWADLAAAEGYADQAHFTREFRAFAGLTPGSYRRAAPAAPRHVPV